MRAGVHIGPWFSGSALGVFTGLLDEVAGAVAAYAVRRLSSEYTGFILRVRRSIDDAEQNIGALASGDLDTLSLETFCGAGDGFVVTWYDQSGNGRDATQATKAKQPQIVSSGTTITKGTASRPTLQTVAANNPALVTAYSRNNRDLTLMAVAAVNDPGGLSGYMFCGEAGATPFDELWFGADNLITTPVVTLWRGDTVTADRIQGTTDQEDSTLRLNGATTASGGAIEVFLNGSSEGTGTIDEDTTFTLALFGDGYRPMNGEISEIVLWDPILSTANRQLAEGNMNIYYTLF